MPALGSASAAPVAEVSSGAGENPFIFASNWYAEKLPTVISEQLGSSVQQFPNININPGQFLRGVRLLIRSASGAGGTAAADNPWNVLSSAELDNVDGSNILFPMGGYAYYLAQKYFRPWNGDPANFDDYSQGNNPAGTLFLQPEIRHGAGVLSNTDARSQYKISLTLNTAANVVGSAATTDPTVTITSYMDAWAQPDAKDLQDVPNQPLPPGLNLQTLRRHEMPTLNAASADNVILSHLTGNEIRGILLILRNSSGTREDYIGDPFRWTLDNRNMGAISPDELWQWMQDFYAQFHLTARPTGVYVLPRFFLPGTMTGQGWMQTNNSTKNQFEWTTPSTATSLPGTVEIITDEVVPIGPIPGELDHI